MAQFGLARLLGVQEVASSNLVPPTKIYKELSDKWIHNNSSPAYALMCSAGPRRGAKRRMRGNLVPPTKIDNEGFVRKMFSKRSLYEKG